MALSVSLTGSGTIGGVLRGWSISEQCSPAIPGDSRGGFGSASLGARAKSDSRFVADNAAVLTSPGGTFRGRVSEVSVTAQAGLSIAGPLQFLNVDKTLPPVWLDQTVDLTLTSYGGGSGQIGRSQGVAVDPVDGGYLVTSQDDVDGADRYKVIKYNSAGAYVTEFGSYGTGNGQIGILGATIAVSPVDQSVWIGDLGNLRIQKFTTADGGLTYSYSTKVGSSGSGNGQFGGSNSYISVAVDSSGNVYASDRGNARIQKFNSSAVYQSQVTIGTPTTSVYAITVNSSNQVLAGIRYDTADIAGQVKIYNSSLVLQQTVTLVPPTTTSFGIRSLAADPDGGVWVVWYGVSHVIYYDATWTETFQWYGETLYYVAAGSNRVIAYLLSYGANSLRRVVAFNYEPVPLSAAVEQYMEACDSTLDGWTLDFQATDPNVVIPGWSGNVWANLRELFATYNVELVRDDSTQTITVRDIGSASTTITNRSPVTTHPVNLTGGRVVDVVYQQPRAGGGVVWDAASENVTLSIGVGRRDVGILYTVQHPAELVQPTPTSSLPISPGQYYVVDSTGAAVSPTTWAAAGGLVSVTVGDSPGTITRTLIGPTAAISGYTGPFYFATGIDASATPALTIVGNGTFCTPTRFVRGESQGNPYNSPFMDTLDRVIQRGHYQSMQDPNVTISFTCPVSELPAMGRAVGTLIPFEESVYRITEVRWGNLTAQVTAERFVTIGDIDTLWTGDSIGTFDTFWSGYSLGDLQVQPLRA